MSLHDNLELAILAAQKAGKIINEGYKKNIKVSVKENNSLVTEIDIASENAIIDTLSSTYPILSEESKTTIADNEEIYWAVDPLDGTTDFVRRIPLFCVSIALIKKGSPVIGVILNPISQELYQSEQDKGSFLNGQRIYVGTDANLIFINSGYGLESKIRSAEHFKRLIPEYWFRQFGSTAYELANVAEGKVDAFICHGDQLWDHAAGISILREAGGVVTDWKGNEWTTKENFVFAANSQAHKRILPLISDLQK